MKDTIQNQKHLFNLAPDVHYLNCAYKAPLLKAAEKACIDQLIIERNPANINSSDFFEEAEEVRVMFGKLINADAGNITIIPSTSYGFSSVLNNIQGKVRGNVITIQDEFPSGYFSLKTWSRDKNQEFKVVKAPGANAEVSWSQKVIEKIDNNTSIVLLSSVHWMHGIKFDLEAIGKKCRTHNAKFIVDGTQSVGAMPINVISSNIDALFCASYKWLFGPYSLALGYISDEFSTGRPLEEAWMNRTNAQDFTSLVNYDPVYLPKAGRFNMGESSNMILMPILKEGLKQIIEWDPIRIQAYCENLTIDLFDFLLSNNIRMAKKEDRSNHLIALNLDEQFDQLKLKQALLNNKVIVSQRGEVVRVAVNVFNDQSDIEQLQRSIIQSKI